MDLGKSWYIVLNYRSCFRTHWKTTNCKPSSLEEELALERSPTDSSGYDCNASDAGNK